jgi:hypothetical protein
MCSIVSKFKQMKAVIVEIKLFYKNVRYTFTVRTI